MLGPAVFGIALFPLWTVVFQVKFTGRMKCKAQKVASKMKWSTLEFQRLKIPIAFSQENGRRKKPSITKIPC